MKKRNIVIMISATSILLAVMIVMNNIMISIRLNELKEQLQDIDHTERSIDHIELVTTYEIHKKMFEKRMTQDQADTIEHTIKKLSLFKNHKNESLVSFYDYLILPFVQLINLNRFILGKMPLGYHRDNDPLSIDMDLAYYYEQNFHFKKAIEYYDKSLSQKNLPDNIIASILLHQGYCYALLQQNEKAKEKYLAILDRYSRESSSITAMVLLRYLEGFSHARKRVLNSGEDALWQGQKLVELLAYKQALAILEEVERKAKPEDLLRINYYKARSLAGMGNIKQAAQTYLYVITSDPSSQYSRYSSRKLFMIGSQTGDKDLVEISIKLNKKMNDKVLKQMIKEHGDHTAAVSVQHNLIQVDIPREVVKQIGEIAAPEKVPAVPHSRYLTIYTSDGNVFKGIVVDETSDYIALKTSIGGIHVKKDRIEKIIEK